MNKRFRNLFLGVLVAFALAYLAAFGKLVAEQDRHIFKAQRAYNPPAQSGLPEAREGKIMTADGETLVVWTVAARDGKPTILYLHGNGGGLIARAERIRQWSADGTGVIAFDWRGFGASTGAPSEAGMKKDAAAAYDFALKSGVAPEELFLFGESLGSGVALWLARDHATAGVLLDSPYSAIVDIAADLYWYFPVRLTVRHPFPAREWIGEVKAPIFAAHGDADRTVLISYGRRLMARAGKNAVFVEVPGAGHLAFARPEVMARAKEWMARVRAP